MAKQYKAMTWAGWIIAGLIALMFTFSAVMKFLGGSDFDKEIARLGYPDGVMFAIGIVELTCLILYLIPRTAVLGAVLLTGYLGGATATHVRIEDPFIGPIVIGIFIWLALFLRDRRVRSLLPIRWPEPPATSIEK